MDVSNEQVLTAVLKLRDEMSPGMKKAADATASFDKASSGLKKTLATLGAALAGIGIMRFIESIIETASELERMSKQTGVSITNLQKIGISAKAAGGNLQEVAMGLRVLSQHAQAAAEGGTEAMAMFNGLGIKINDSNGRLKTAEMLFGDLADVISTVESPTLKMSIATQMLGRSGAQLIPIMSGGRDALYEVGDAAEAMGGILSTKAVHALDDFGNQVSATKTVFTNMMGNWLADTGITMPKIIDWFGRFAKSIQYFVALVKIAFNTMAEATKFLANTIYIWFNAIVQTIAIAVAKSIEPIIELSKFLLKHFGQYLPDAMRDTLSGITSFMDNVAKQDLAAPFQKAAADTGKAWDTMALNIADANKKIVTNTDSNVDAMTSKLNELKQAIGAAAGPRSSAAGAPGGSSAGGGNKAAGLALDSILGSPHAGSPHNMPNVQQNIDDALELQMGRAKNQAKTDEFTRTTGIVLTTQQLNDLAAAAKKGESAFTEMLEAIKKGTEADPFKGAQLALDDLIKESYNFRDAWGGIFKDLKSGFSDMFANAIEGTDSFAGGFKKAMKTLKHDLIKMFTDFAVNGLFQGAGSGLSGMLGLLGGGGGGSTAANAAVGASGGAASASNAGASLTGAAVSMQSIGGALGLSAGTMGAVAGLGAAGLALGAGGVKAGNRTQSTAGGALTGAALGTMVMPGIGTAVGAVVGAIAGFVMGSSARRKRLKKARAAAAAAAAAYQAALQQARVVLKADIRNKYAGGLATEDAASDYGHLLSGDLSAEEINQFGSPEAIAAQAGAVNKQTTVNAPINIQATIGGSYDVARLAEEISYHLQNQMSGSASGI